MTAAAEAFLVVYAAGVICLIGQLLTYPARHRAGGRITRAEAFKVAEAAWHTRVAWATFQALMAEKPRYNHHLGAGRYAHLRSAELEATAERDLRWARLGLGPKPDVDLQALRMRAPLFTVREVDDEFYAASVGAA